MDPIENAFFEDIIYQESSNSEYSDQYPSHENGKENKKKMKRVQREMLLSAMDGRTDCISKGKTKTDEKTIRLLSEWSELTTELNSLGPPHHTSQKWRRIWTKMKSTKKRKISSVLGSRKENRKVRCQPNRHKNTWKSSDSKKSVISTIGQVQQEQRHIKSSDVVNVTSTVVSSQYHRKSNNRDSTIQSVESERRVHPDLHNLNNIVLCADQQEGNYFEGFSIELSDAVNVTSTDVPSEFHESSDWNVISIIESAESKAQVNPDLHNLNNIVLCADQQAGNYIEGYSIELSDAVNVTSTVVPSEFHPSSDWDNVMSTSKSVESERRIHPEPNDMRNKKSTVEPAGFAGYNEIKAEFSRILHSILSLSKRQDVIIETMSKKLDDVIVKQEKINEKMNILAKAIGINIDTEKL